MRSVSEPRLQYRQEILICLGAGFRRAMDGAHIACGGGTAYEALLRANANGNDRVLITGLGPVGLYVGMIAQALGVKQVIGVDFSEERVKIAQKIGAITDSISASGSEAESFIREDEAAFDCSGNVHARTLALRGTQRWGRAALVGAGGRLEIDGDELEPSFKHVRGIRARKRPAL